MSTELQQFFGFSEPFGSINDPADMFSATSRAGLLSGIVNDVLAGPIVTSIRGGPGVGKTCFARCIAAELRARDVTVVQFDGVSQSPLKVQRQLGEALSIDAATMMKADQLLQTLQTRDGMERIVLLFDNADALTVTVFRYLQLLVDLFEYSATRLSIILIGGFGQWANLEQTGLEAIRSATSSVNMLFSLRDDEAKAYLEHIFDCAGRPLRELMSRSAVTALLEHANGNPARIKAITKQALQLAYDNSQKRITLTRLCRVLPANDVDVGSSRRQLTATLAAAMVLAVAGTEAFFVWRGHDQTGDAPVAVASSAVEQPSAPPTVNTQAVPAEPSEPKQSGPEHSAADAQPLAPPPTAPAPIAPATMQAALDPAPATDAAALSMSQPFGLSEAPRDTPKDLSEHEPGPLATLSLTMASEQPVAETAPLAGTPGPPRELDASEVPPPDAAAPEPPHLAARPDQQPSVVALTASERILTDRVAPPLSQRGGPGLVLVARGEDSIKTLYAQIYRGMTPPPYSAVLAANPSPVHPGALLIFPEPPDGWSTRRSRKPTP